MLGVVLLNRLAAKQKALKQQQKVKLLKQQLEKARKLDRKPTVKAKKPESVFCRTCMATENLVAIFYDTENEEKRSKELKLVTGLEIKINDGLSQKICSNCVESINTSLQFRKRCRKTEKILLGFGSARSKTKYNTRLRMPKKLKQAKVEKVELDDYSYEIFAEEFQNGDDDYVFPGVVKTEGEPKRTPRRPLKKRQIALAHRGGYKCNICEKEFKLKATYNSHMRFHTDFCICEACGKRCRNYNQLQEHKRAKHGLFKIHKCAYCEYSSATKEALIIHERRHTGERPYVCDHCGATFHRRANLVQHIAIHLPEKNFQCEYCSHREKSQKRLNIHKYHRHRERKYRYLCPQCPKVYRKPDSVRRHLIRHHDLPRHAQGPLPKYKIDDKELDMQSIPYYEGHKVF